jgi:hypothetical protein
MSSFLTDAVSAAEQQAKLNVKGQISSTVQGVKGAVANAQNNISSALSGAANNAVKGAIGSVVGAASSLLSGNLSGAAASLLNAPAAVFQGVTQGLGGFASALGLSSPGTSAFSTDGGISPGNSLAGASARPDPLLSFTWYAQLPVISSGSTQSSSGSVAGSALSGLAGSILNPLGNALSSALGGSVATSASAQLPWYYVEEATCPFRTYETISIFREGRDRKYPSKYNVDNLRLGIYADSQNKAFSYLQAWNNNILTPFSSSTSTSAAGGWGRPTDYEKSIFVYLLDANNQMLTILEYTECWPVSIDQYSLDSGSSTRIINQVNFSVGDVIINVIPVSANVSASVLANPGSNILSTAINSLGSSVTSLGSNLLQRGVSSISSAVSSIF